MIFTERTITVVNDSATINKPLILYRGDKNIELKITIVESQFKFRSTGASNVIETANASYAQLVINTPYNSPIFSEVTATENGTVIFVISAAMIDEVREVGIYDIQIRLLDDNKQSRVTIPPVSNAIEIREPMAIEDGSAVDSNAVNVAKVNRALTTTSAPLEAFDSQGNYIKKTWGDGDPITDAALNKMEAGIDGVNKKIGNNSWQIKNKANKSDLEVQKQRLNNLLDVYYEVTSNNRIDDSKFVGKNFDTIFGHSGGTTLKLDSRLKNKSIKGFIEFEDGTSPDISAGFGWSLVSSTGEVDSLPLSVVGTLVTSDNFDKYDEIYLECWTTYNKNIKTFFIGDFNASYDNFKREAKSKAIENVEGKINNITPEQCTFFTKVDNLLKNINLQKGYAINPSYGLPDAISGIERTSTDYIELRDDCESTYCNTNGYIYYYDANKNYLQSITPQNTETPAGIVALPQSDTKIKYIRYTFVTEDDATLASYWITDQGKPYENDKLYIPKDMIEDMSKTESWYKGKKICAYGDSVTEQNKWQPYVSTYFNCSFYNRGVGGTTVTQVNSSTNHMSGDTRINTIPTDSDVILIFAGHNDWSYASIAMGNLKTDALSESTSFKSSFALMLKKIQARCPNARLITMTPVGGRTEDAATNQDKQFYVRDLCMTDFAIAVKEVSAYFGIPCIDINANSGVNTLNHTTYIADLIHPNVEGGKLIANEVINGMKRFEPIDL